MGVSVRVGVTVMNHRGLLFLIVHRWGWRRGRGLLKHANILWGRRRRRGGAVCYWKRTDSGGEKESEKSNEKKASERSAQITRLLSRSDLAPQWFSKCISCSRVCVDNFKMQCFFKTSFIFIIFGLTWQSNNIWFLNYFGYNKCQGQWVFISSKTNF